MLAAQGVLAVALAAVWCAHIGSGQSTAGDVESWWLLPLLTGYSAMCLAPAAGYAANAAAGRAAADEAAAWPRAGGGGGGGGAAREPGAIDWSPAGLRDLEAAEFDARLRRTRGQEGRRRCARTRKR